MFDPRFDRSSKVYGAGDRVHLDGRHLLDDGLLVVQILGALWSVGGSLEHDIVDDGARPLLPRLFLEAVSYLLTGLSRERRVVGEGRVPSNPGGQIEGELPIGVHGFRGERRLRTVQDLRIETLLFALRPEGTEVGRDLAAG